MADDVVPLANAARRDAVQGPDRDFAFHTLGWYQFQNLCSTILTDLLGQTVQVFAPGNDAGRDASFQGVWTPNGRESYAGSFTFQVKYSRYPDKSISESVLSDDLTKAKELARAGLCDNYFVMTNYIVTATREAELKARITSIPGIKCAAIFGPHWLTETIRASKRLRFLVPRVYGLGDLSSILNERALKQADAILRSFESRLKTVVPTDAYKKAAEALDEYGFVLLIGDPMSGKTTISYALALGALDYLKLDVFIARSPEEFLEHWDPGNPNSFYWIDDAFGQTQYENSLALSWSKHLDALKAAIERKARFVFTSRTYIWKAADSGLKRYQFTLFEQSQVRIYVEDLTKAEKQQILYHHLRMGSQPAAFKKGVKPYLNSLAEINYFLPEAARRLGDYEYDDYEDYSPGSRSSTSTNGMGPIMQPLIFVEAG